MVEFNDKGEVDEPFLPFGVKILDAREEYNNLNSYESLYIRKAVNGRLWLASRSFVGPEVDWTYKFPVTDDEAEEIVSLGYAYWHWSLDRKKSGSTAK